MKTYAPKPRDIERRWYVIDASGAVLGRLASEVAAILRGKHKPMFAPHMDTGDNVIVVNAALVQLTGDKGEKKFAYRHSGYPGGLTATKYARLLVERPAFAVEKAIKGMLPKNRLGRAMVRKLHVYAGPDHRHQAQKPEPLALGDVPRWEGLPKPEAKTAPEPKAPKTRAAKTRAPKTRAAEKPAPKRTSARAAAAKKTTAKRSTAKATTSKSPAKKTTARRTKKEE
jgi:large subunit ribosomal protein L13